MRLKKAFKKQLSKKLQTMEEVRKRMQKKLHRFLLTETRQAIKITSENRAFRKTAKFLKKIERNPVFKKLYHLLNFGAHIFTAMLLLSLVFFLMSWSGYSWAKSVSKLYKPISLKAGYIAIKNNPESQNTLEDSLLKKISQINNTVTKKLTESSKPKIQSSVPARNSAGVQGSATSSPSVKQPSPNIPAPASTATSTPKKPVAPPKVTKKPDPIATTTKPKSVPPLVYGGSPTPVPKPVESPVVITIPNTFFVSKPPSLSTVITSNFVFGADKSPVTYEYSIDNGNWVASNGSLSINLAEGLHNIRVRAKDSAGTDQTPAEYVWTIDTTPDPIIIGGSLPISVVIDTAPSGILATSSATFTFTSNKSPQLFSCKLDSGPWEDCFNPHILQVAEGIHTFSLVSIDSSQNQSEIASANWSVDLTPPSTFINDIATATDKTLYDEEGIEISYSAYDPIIASSSSGVKDYQVQYKIDDNAWQDWKIDFASTSALFTEPLEDGQVISFRVRSKDVVGNVGDWSEVVTTELFLPPPPPPPIDHLLISEVKLGMDQFIEIYNPTASAIDLHHYSLVLKTATTSFELVPPEEFMNAGQIDAYSYILIAREDFAGVVMPDLIYLAEYSLDINNAIILYHDASEIDVLGWGAINFHEGEPADNPPSGWSLERKASATSTLQSMANGGIENSLGNSYDSDNNQEDFILRNVPDPQNSEEQYSESIAVSTTHLVLFARLSWFANSIWENLGFRLANYFFSESSISLRFLT